MSRREFITFVGDSIAHRGGNTTGFMQSEYSLNSKLLELLKQIVPQITHAAVLRDLANPAGISQFSAIQAVASSTGMTVSPVSVRDGSASATVHRDLIVMLAARHKIPAIYSDRFIVTRGGLISYGPDRIDQYRRAAGYVDRILKRREAGRSSDPDSYQVRTGRQPQDCEGARPYLVTKRFPLKQTR